MKVVLYSPTSFTPGCGVGDHGIRLAVALSCMADVRLATRVAGGEPPPELGEERVWRLAGRPGAGRRSLDREFARFRPDVFLLEYAPHLGSPRGLDRSGLLAAFAARRRRVPVVLFFHEIASPWSLEPAALVTGCHQRAVALLLLGLSRGAIVTSFERVRDLTRLGGTRRLPVVLIPIGSNVRASRWTSEDRSRRRASRGIADGSFVLSLFGRDHWSRRTGPALAALDLLVAEGMDAHLVVLGLAGRALSGVAHARSRSGVAHARSGETARVPPALQARVHILGFLPEDEISGWLGASDLYLLPLSDGVSTRRTTLAAALAHGLPVLGTRGPNTDPDLFGREFVRLVPCGEGDGAFARAALILARDPGSRTRLGRAAKKAHDELFAWDVAARRVIEFATRSGAAHRAGIGSCRA
ncbi:MAG: glycosyltransferase family 4 protein [Planctomycetes bacterium]|nr:glycosyltransferase family 4 protein [Planctomycetota bacterium]